MPKSRRAQVGVPEARSRILAATVEAMGSASAKGLTIEAVARRAGCAKGLVNYHFKTKAALFSAAAERLWDDRVTAWQAALERKDPTQAINAGWGLVGKEARSGVTRACNELASGFGDMVDRTVSNQRKRFIELLAHELTGLFRRMAMIPTVPTADLAALLAAAIEGLAIQMAGGIEEDQLEPAWSAFWAGMLSLTRPIR